MLRQAFAKRGYRAAYLAERDRLMERSRRGYVPPMLIAYAAAGGGDVDGALEFLERAYHERQDDLSAIHVNPRVANLRTDPRFLELVRRVGVGTRSRGADAWFSRDQGRPETHASAYSLCPRVASLRSQWRGTSDHDDVECVITMVWTPNHDTWNAHRVVI